MPCCITYPGEFLRLFVTVFLSGLTVVGCSHTHTFTPNDADGYYERINKAGQTQNILIRLDGGDERRGANIHVGADSVTWMTPDPFTRRFTRRRGVPTGQVSEIVVTNRTKSGLIGTGLGMLAGGLLGVFPDMVNSIKGNQFDAGRTLFFGGLLAAFGGIVGGVAGVKKGTQDIFIFSEYLEGSDAYFITQQLKGVLPGVDDVLSDLRRGIRGLNAGQIKEMVTQSNIIYTIDDNPFCFLVVNSRSVKIYLSATQTDVSDPLGLLRPWSTRDSWFAISPGGDMDYAINLIQQAYAKVST
jgi:predicted transport protein